MTALVTAQHHHDFSTPTESPLTDTCTDLANLIHQSLNKSGFDVDGIEVEPHGEFELLVSCSPFPSISVTLDSLHAMTEEWLGEIEFRLSGAKVVSCQLIEKRKTIKEAERCL